MVLSPVDPIGLRRAGAPPPGRFVLTAGKSEGGADASEIGPRGSGGTKRSDAGSGDWIGAAGPLAPRGSLAAAKLGSFNLTGNCPNEAPDIMMHHAPKPVKSKQAIPTQASDFSSSPHVVGRTHAVVAIVVVEARDSSNTGAGSGAGTKEPTW